MRFWWRAELFQRTLNSQLGKPRNRTPKISPVRMRAGYPFVQYAGTRGGFRSPSKSPGKSGSFPMVLPLVVISAADNFSGR
jgi:hypothetical protein